MLKSLQVKQLYNCLPPHHVCFIIFSLQILQKLIYLYLFTDFFMKISLQSSEQILKSKILDLKFVPMIGEKSSCNRLETNADKLTSVIFVHKALH